MQQVVTKAIKKKGVVKRKAFNVKDLTNKVWKFCMATSKKDAYEYQEKPAKRIIECLLTDSAVITILMARQCGKTTMMEILIPGLMIILPRIAKFYPKQLGKYKEGFWVGLFAAADEQIMTMFSRIRDVLDESGQDVINDPDIMEEVRSKVKSVYLAGCKSVCRMQSADKRAKIESKTYHLLVNDEAHLTESMVYNEKISPMGTATDATEVKIGVGYIRRNHFYASIRSNVRRRANGGKQNHFRYDDDEVMAVRRKKYKQDKDLTHLNYAKYIKRKRLELQTASLAYRVAYKLEFPLGHGMFTTLKEMRSLRDKSRNWELTSQKICVAGMDLAKEICNTVLTIKELDFSKMEKDEFGDLTGMPTNKTLDILELEGVNWEEQYPEIIHKLLQYNIAAFAIDSTGVGNPIFERYEVLLEDYDIELIACVYSGSSKHDFYTYYMQEWQAGRESYPASAKAQDTTKFLRWEQQHEDLVKVWKNKYMSCEKPDEEGALDDICDSSCLATWASKWYTENELDSVGVSENNFLTTSRGFRDRRNNRRRSK